MRTFFIWILLLILQCFSTTSWPLSNTHIESPEHDFDYNAQNVPKTLNTQAGKEQVISVRITSSIAVGRRKPVQKIPTSNISEYPKETLHMTTASEITESATGPKLDTSTKPSMTNIPSDLSGANIEFIKQLNAKKEGRGNNKFEQIHPFRLTINNQYFNETEDSIAEPSIKSVAEINDKNNTNDDNIDYVPLARSIPSPLFSKSYLQGSQIPLNEQETNIPKLTTVSFNVVHDATKVTANYNEPSNTYIASKRDHVEGLPQFYSEPLKLYSQPSQIYSEPAKFYSEPAKIYSEPAKIYSEPSKIYSEPSKIYSEPAKFYSEPASLHITPNFPDSRPTWEHQGPVVSNTIKSTTPLTTVVNPSVIPKTQSVIEQQPEKNYEVDEKISIQTDGRSHGVQGSNKENCKHDNCKVGYVVEGRQFRKYRVEERTPDGFIVGEYGVVRNEDGALRGVRYTADSEASPRLIYDALMKFLQLR